MSHNCDVFPPSHPGDIQSCPTCSSVIRQLDHLFTIRSLNHKKASKTLLISFSLNQRVDKPELRPKQIEDITKMVKELQIQHSLIATLLKGNIYTLMLSPLKNAIPTKDLKRLYNF